ncbi:hypothetical protein [Emcibacter sp.]|uniref:hypothetical protein n=1 Tax=Emcibacter sp. TaxID=1979954 RepID=UPI002AA78FE3|nr:hypothetical protein [Emcibacter sp.]
MYICICNALKESTVRQAARNCTPDIHVSDLYESMGVEPKCGQCLCRAQDVLEEETRTCQVA